MSTEGEQNENCSNQDEIITCRLKRLDDSTIKAEKQIHEARMSKHRNIKIADLIDHTECKDDRILNDD